MPHHFNRRTALAAGAAALFGPRAASAAEQADVIVIGAGLAGLSAALQLQAAGAKVTLLEGASRIGGRVLTGDGIDTRPELGATQIGGSYTRVRKAASAAGVTLEPEDRDIQPFAYYLNGSLVGEKDWAGSTANKTVGEERAIPPMRLGVRAMSRLNPLVGLDDWLKPEHLTLDVSPGELMRGMGMSEEAIRLAELTSGGGDIWGVSALAMFQEQTRTNYERVRLGLKPGEKDPTHAQDPERVMTWVVSGGTSRLVEGMHRQLKSPARLNQIVSAVLQDATGVEVRTMGGGRYRAKQVICAVPFNVLRFVAFEPAPRGQLNDALHQMGTGHTSRAWLSITAPYWEQDGLEPSLLTDEGIGMLWLYDNAKSKRNDWRALVVTTGDGARRLDALPDAARKEFVLAELGRIRPSLKGKARWLAYKSWTKEPLIQACRHMYLPGQVRAFRDGVWESHGRVHFAGEHCRRIDYGMEAAFESAERAVERVLKA